MRKFLRTPYGLLQADIEKKTSMVSARAAEAEFFAERPEYAEVSEKCGVANLARRLNGILVEHIRTVRRNSIGMASRRATGWLSPAGRMRI